MPKLNAEQSKVVNIRSVDMIVSAGAGSGKTHTLTERIIEMVKDGVSINNILVVTFTVLASLEMKERIRAALKDANLHDALAYLDSAYICTFDSFSLSILKKYAYLIGKDKDINVTDQALIDTLTKGFVREALDEAYQGIISCPIEFDNMVKELCIKNDNILVNTLISFNNFLDNEIKKEDILNNYFERYFSDIEIDKNIKKYEEMIINKISMLKGSFIDLLNDLEDKTRLHSKMEDVFNVLSKIETYKDAYEVFVKTPFSLPSKSKNDEVLDTYDEKRKALKESIDGIRALLRYESLDGYKDELKKTIPYSKVIIELLKKINEKINDYKNKYNLYTFQDVSRLVIKLLEDNESVRLELRDKFQEIMIDEYQDTNDVQDYLISLISNNNVCIVGDVKQSIYGFRGANPNIFKTKYDLYKNGESDTNKCIDLLYNYRSREEVVNTVNKIFSSCMIKDMQGIDYKNEHMMRFGNKQYTENVSKGQNYDTEVLNYKECLEYVIEHKLPLSRYEIEAFIIGNDIKKKLDTFNIYNFKEKEIRKARFSDFCIIAPSTTHFDSYKQVFEYLSIPLSIVRDVNVSLNEGLLVFKNIVILLDKIIKQDFENEYDINYLYTSIARSFLFRKEDKYIYDMIINGKAQSMIKGEKVYHTDDIILKLYDIRNFFNTCSIKELIEKILDVFDFNKKYNSFDSYEAGIKLTNFLCENVSSFDVYDDPFSEYVSFLINLIDTETKQKIKEELTDSDAVILMNAHKSKGLEYQVCYYSDLYTKFNLDDVSSKWQMTKDLGLVIPYYEDGLNYSFYNDLCKYNKLKTTISERLRLFYVSLTRAKEHIVLVDAFDNDVLSNEHLEWKMDELLSLKSYSGLLYKMYHLFKDNVKSIDYKESKISYNYLNEKKSVVLKKTSDKSIKTKKINISFGEEQESFNYSKKTYKLRDDSEIMRLRKGEEIHYILECLNYKDKDIMSKIASLDIEDFYKYKIKKFINSDIMKDVLKASIYKEYKFIYKNSLGIIDLMLEYDDHIDIIDYKLKNIDDDAYVKQLNAYKEYIETIYKNKRINLYLYSIIEETTKSV